MDLIGVDAEMQRHNGTGMKKWLEASKNWHVGTMNVWGSDFASVISRLCGYLRLRGL